MGARTRFLLSAVVIRLLLISDTSSASSALWGDLTPGKYQVGFKVIYALDSTRRTPTAPTGRPVQISIWYPGVATPESRHLLYRDYFVLSASELDSTHVTPEDKRVVLENYRRLLASNGIQGKSVDGWMGTQMEAFLGLPPVGEAFPLILVVQGNMHSAHHQAILCEYLASHGNVVVTCPSQTRISGPLKSEDAVALSASEQSEDIHFVRTKVLTEFNVDSTRIALVAHSFGARSALVFVARYPHQVRGMVSLDGGIGSKTANDFTRQIPGFDLDRVTIPLLHIYEETDPVMKPDFALIRSLRQSERYLVRVDGMRHRDFSSFGMVAGTIPGFNGSSAGDKEGEAVKRSCEAIYGLTEGFLVSCFSEAPPGHQSNPDIRIAKGSMHLTRFRSGED